MARQKVPSPELLRKLLHYEPETGLMFWRERGAEWRRYTSHTYRYGYEGTPS